MLALVLGGNGGTIYKVISPDGWIAQAFGRRRLGERLVSWFVIYGFAAAGILYLLQLWIKGTL